MFVGNDGLRHVFTDRYETDIVTASTVDGDMDLNATADGELTMPAADAAAANEGDCTSNQVKTLRTLRKRLGGDLPGREGGGHRPFQVEG